jgi:hypothetical protein
MPPPSMRLAPTRAHNRRNITVLYNRARVRQPAAIPVKFVSNIVALRADPRVIKTLNPQLSAVFEN